MTENQSSNLDWSAIKVFAMDVDGILTDGAIYISSDGSEAKRFSIIDGLGLARLREAGIILAWISGRHSNSTTVRAKELKIPHLIQGKLDKVTGLRDLLAELNLDPSQAVYMGDDVIDVDAIKHAGIGVTVSDALPEAIAVADYVTTKAGGHGAVREVCDLIYKAISK